MTCETCAIVTFVGVHRRSYMLLRVHRIRHNSHNRRRGYKPQKEHPAGHCHQPDDNPDRIRHHVNRLNFNW